MPLCGGAPAFPIPKGLRPKAQGCEERATLGQRVRKTKAQWGFDFSGSQPRWGCCFARLLLRVARSSQLWALLRNPVGIPGKVTLPNLICAPRIGGIKSRVDARP